MTASNGIRTEHKIKRLAAALALAIAAMLGSSCLSPARADAAGTSEGNLVIDVPTTVPCALMADGTVVSPSEWNITTSGGAYVASASASGFPANVEWSAKTTDLAAGQAGSVEVAGAGDAASVAGPSDPADAALATTARFEWSFSKLDADKNSDIIGKAAGGTAVLGSVTFTFAKVEPDAFAVYSADDNSLSFYKRAGVPVAGQTFEGKTATEVYTGIETMTSIPGWTQNHFNDIKTVTVYDEGIAPTGTAFWFAGVRNLKTADVSKLDMSRCKTIECMFTDCTSLETLDLSGWDTSSLTNMSQAFHHCASLTKLNVSGWDVSKVTNMQLAFAEDTALGSLDLSTWDNSATTSMKDAFLQMDSLSEISLGSKFKFVGTNGYLPTPSSAYIAGADGKWYDTDGNGYAPADIPSNKAMTYTAVAPKKAFAVYSADDDSLSFYKRSGIPAVGDAFEGKTATEIYEGIEKDTYTMADGAPWSGHAADIASVTVADAGVSPVSTAYWFKGASKLKSVNLAGLDTSQASCMDGMFDGCSSLETLDLSNMSTRRVASMSAFLGGCDSLAELSIGSEFAWVGEDCYPPTGDWKQGSTGTDYSESDIPANKTDKYTRTKTAFAVYSADDNSLTFYKRPVAPTEETQFLGKTASKVFTGFETGTYSPSSVPWAAYRSNVKTVTVADAGVAPVSTANWFYFFTNATSIDLSKLDTGKVTSMLCTFYGCESLTTLDLSSFDTGNVTDMRSLFQDCNALTVLDLSSFDTRNITNMSYLFNGCSALQKVTFGAGWKWVVINGYLPTPNSAYIAGADGKWYDTDGNGYAPADIPSNKAMTYTAVPPARPKTAFAVYSADDGSLNFYKRISVPATGDQFEGKTASRVYTGIESASYTSSTQPWKDYRSSIKTAKVVDDGIMPMSCAYWFYGCSKMTNADVKKLDVSKATDLSSVFEMCSSLTSIEGLPSWDVGSATKIVQMFFFCSKLTSVGDLSNWDVSKVVKANGMFAFCSKLTSVGDLSNWDVSNVDTATMIFYKCSSIKTFGDLSRWNTSNMIYMQEMFEYCSSLTSLGNLSGWDTSKAKTIRLMFNGCTSLTSLEGIGKWDTSNVEDSNGYAQMAGVFEDCSNITKLDLSNWSNAKTSPSTNSQIAVLPLFGGMTRLQQVTVGDKWEWKKSSIESWLLPTPSAAYIPGADGKWYAKSTGIGYAPDQIPSFKADTYYASKNLLPQAFAVYSADDNSLNFYKRAGMPSAGNQFEGKTATEVYTGFETETYSNTDSAPWSTHYNRIETVVIADDGIAPKSTASWFKGFHALRSADVSKLDMSKCKDVSYMFWECNSLESIDMSTWDTSSFENVSYMLGFCRRLGELDVLSWNVSNITNMEKVFYACSNVRTLDISTWDNSKIENMDFAFNGMSHLEKIKLGDKFNWIGSGQRLPYPDIEFIPTAVTNKWYAESTGVGYSPEGIPPFKADTYYASKALRDAAVGAASDPVDDDATAVSAAAISVKAQCESATQKAVEGVPPLEEKASKESSATTEPDGAEKDGEAKLAVENEATKEDVSAIVPEGAEKAAMKKSGE